VKNFYKEAESVTNRSEKDNKEFMDTNHIKATGADIPRPIVTFEESGLSKHILAKLKEVKFEKPSPIQS
jgi:superfamily II DNA/RNA helicase